MQHLLLSFENNFVPVHKTKLCHRYAIGFYTTLCQSFLHLCLTSLSFLLLLHRTRISPHFVSDLRQFIFGQLVVVVTVHQIMAHYFILFKNVLFHIPSSLFHTSVQNNPLLLLRISRFDPFMF